MKNKNTSLKISAAALTSALILCGCGSSEALAEPQITDTTSQSLIEYIEQASETAAAEAQTSADISIPETTAAPNETEAEAPETENQTTPSEENAEVSENNAAAYVDEAVECPVTAPPAELLGSDVIMVSVNSQTFLGYSISNGKIVYDEEYSDDSTLYFRTAEPGVETLVISESGSGGTEFIEYNIVVYDDLSAEIVDSSANYPEPYYDDDYLDGDYGVMPILY